MRHAFLAAIVAALAPQPGSGQTSAPPAVDPTMEARFHALEQRVEALQAELQALRAATARPPEEPPGPSPSPPAAPSALSAAPTGGEHPHPSSAQLPVYGTGGPKVFNPDIGLIGNFVGAAGPSRGGSDAVSPLPFLALQESEASFQAIVDPYARADFFLAIGEEGIEVEEGYATFPTLPGGLLVKAGKMRATFGRLNSFHNHTLPWVDRPLVMFNLMGGESTDPDTGIKDAGVSLSRLVPAGKLFVEATAEVMRGDSGTLFQASRRRDFSIIGHLRSYADLTEQTNVEVGGSYARGHNDAGSEFLTQLYGVDLTLRWRPLRRAIYQSFAGRTELMWSRRQEPSGVLPAFGGFISADYRFNRRWFAGLRYDWSERARRPDVRDRGASGVLTFWPSEFTQVRGQYRYTDYGDRRPANEILFQLLFTMGAHGAHAF